MEADYEHECLRAELLGLPRPTREQFENSRAEISKLHHGEKDENEYQEEETEGMKEKAENENERKEGLRRMTGGLDELNSILVNTQKKLNKIKNVFGNFTSLVRSQSEQDKEEGEKGSSNFSHQDGTKENERNGNEGEAGLRNCAHYSMKSEKPDGDKLDLLINKAERAEMSLASQNKQMKKFLN